MTTNSTARVRLVSEMDIKIAKFMFNQSFWCIRDTLPNELFWEYPFIQTCIALGLILKYRLVEPRPPFTPRWRLLITSEGEMCRVVHEGEDVYLEFPIESSNE